MSPILVRPVREQFEHDRVIRVLQAKYKRKYEVAINPGPEQNASVGIGDLTMYPDLVLFSQERSRKVQGTVEVETTESVNTLEAMAEWGPFSRLRAAFFLYVPANTIDSVRRLCADYNISPAEIWTYHVAIDQVRFTMVYRSPNAPRVSEPRDRADKPLEAAPATSRTPVAESRKAPGEVRKPVAESRTLKAESRTPKAGSRKPAAQKAKANTVKSAAKPAKPAKPVKPVKPAKPVKTAKAAKAARPAKAKPAARVARPAPRKRR